jgi:hypothetical protein
MAVLSSAAGELFFQAFEPKVSNRFVLIMDGIPSYLIKSFKAPVYTSDVNVLDHINIKRKLKGKSDWSDSSMTLYDPIVPSGAQAVIEWVRLHHESVTGRDGYADFYKKDLTLEVLGPVGDIVGEIICKGCLISNSDFGSFDWSNGAPVELNITVAMDYAIFNF